MPNIERLQQLRRVVEAAPDDLLHMQDWSEKAPCGTARCAAGWCAVDPWFQANTEIGEIFEVKEDGLLRTVCLCPSNRLADLFDIDRDVADCVFATYSDRGFGPHDITKEEVLDNIDCVLVGDDPEPYDATIYREDDD